MPILEIQKLKAPELERLDRENTIFFLPVGTLEDHGPALPLGSDAYEAEGLGRKLAEKIQESDPTMNFVFFPACHLGIDSSTSKLSLKVRPHVLRDYLVDVCEGLVRVGFKKFVCVSGNLGPAHLTAIEEAGKFLRTKHMRFGLFGRKSAPILVSANSIALLDDEKSNNPIWCDPKEHGGARDIEMALTLFPALVDPLWKGLPEIEKSPTGFPRWLKFRKGEISGYWGKPARADTARGFDRLNEKISTIIPKLKAVWSGSDSNHLFRSWYSIYPPNKSLFKAWILVFSLIFLMAVWIVVTLQTFLQGAEF